MKDVSMIVTVLMRSLTVFDDRLIAGAVFEPDGVPDLLAEADAHFFGHTRSNRHRCNTTWLGASDLLTSFRISCLVQELRQLCSLARSCLSNYDQDLELLYRLQELFPPFVDRQRLSHLVDRLDSLLCRIDLSLQGDFLLAHIACYGIFQLEIDMCRFIDHIVVVSAGVNRLAVQCARLQDCVRGLQLFVAEQTDQRRCKAI